MVYSTNFIGKRFSDIALNIGGETIDRVTKLKYLGVVFDENLSWEEHIKQVHSKASSRLYLYRQIRNFLDTKQSKIVFTSLVQSVMDYADTIWSSCSFKSQNALQKIRSRGLRCIHNIPNFRAKSHHIADLLHQTGWTGLATRR